jgi:Zn-dependent M28 family amino/carboxypeptidase
MQPNIQQDIAGKLYYARSGLDFCEELVECFGARFGGTEQERAAAGFIAERLQSFGLAPCGTEEFECPGWTRGQTRLTVTAPVIRTLDCIALPYCPPGETTGRLVSVGDGDPQVFAARAADLDGAIVMVSSAAPAFVHRPMHRTEKAGRALAAGARAVIWMRGAPGGLPETGSTPFGRSSPVPVIAVSYEVGHELLRLARRDEVALRIESTNENHPVRSRNAFGEFRGTSKADEIILVGGHYDGHDISQAAVDNASCVAGMLEAARALAPYRDRLARTIRFVGFAQEEMGLHGAHHHVRRHRDENIRFMLNHDGGARGVEGMLKLHGWPEATEFMQGVMRDLNDPDVIVGNDIDVYSDDYAFVAAGIPCATLRSRALAAGASSGANRGYQHTSMDTLDKVSARYIQIDAIRVACIAFELATLPELPLRRKSPAEVAALLAERGLDSVLRLEQRPFEGVLSTAAVRDTAPTSRRSCRSSPR